MPPNQNTTQNQDSEKNSIPPSPQEPVADVSIPTIVSTPAEVPSEATEAPGDGFSAKSDNIPSSSSTLTDSPNEEKPEEKSAPNEPNSEPVSEPKQAPESATAQILVNEPLGEPEHSQAKPVSVNSKSSLARELLITARNAIQFRKRKKLDRVMSLFLQQSKITNDEEEMKKK